jgi:hypothetical protein
MFYLGQHSLGFGEFFFKVLDLGVLLREFIDGLRIEGQHLLPKNLTEPLTYHAVEKTFSAWRLSLGSRDKNIASTGSESLRSFNLPKRVQVTPRSGR